MPMAAIQRIPLAIWRALLAAAVMAACTMAVLPEPPLVPGNPPDTYLHAAAFAIIAGLARLAFPAASLWRLLVPLALLGLGIEIAQTIPALGRDASVKDFIVDVLAALVALVITAPMRAEPSIATRHATLGNF